MEYIYSAGCNVDYMDMFNENLEGNGIDLGIYDDCEKAIKACNDYDPMNDDRYGYNYFMLERIVKITWVVSKCKLNTTGWECVWFKEVTDPLEKCWKEFQRIEEEENA